MVKIVGDHATSHAQFTQAPLTSDILGICRPVSDWLHHTKSPLETAAGLVEPDGDFEASLPPDVIARLHGVLAELIECRRLLAQARGMIPAEPDPT